LDRVTCVSVSHATGLLEQEEEEEEKKMNGFRVGDNQIEAQHRHISESQQDRLEAVANVADITVRVMDIILPSLTMYIGQSCD
jgi:hypothetical protein